MESGSNVSSTIGMYALVAVSMIIRLRSMCCMVVFSTALARASASTRIMWRDWLKRMPSDVVKIITESTMIPSMSLLANDLRILIIRHLLS